MAKPTSLLFVLAGVIALASSAAAQDAVPGNSIDLPHAWPRPGGIKLLENERGTMWNITFEAGFGSRWHKHLYDFFGVDLANSATEIINPDGSMRTVLGLRGKMFVLPKGVTHMERGLTNPGRNFVVVDLKEVASPAYAGGGKLPKGFAGAKAIRVNETPRVLQWDVTWLPGAPERQTFHTMDIFVAIVDGGKLKISEVGQEARTLDVKGGEGFFLKGGVARKIESIDGQVHAMVAELK